MQNILCELDKVKSASVDYVTNIYNVEQLSDTCKEICNDAHNSFLALVPQHKYLRLFFAGEREAVQEALKKLDVHVSMPVVADIVSRSTETAIFQDTKFVKYSMLTRLVKQKNEKTEEPHSPAKYVIDSDIGEIEKLFEEEFNIYVDQIPSRMDITNAIKNDEIIGIWAKNSLAGFLWLERKGRTSTIRYWCVAPDCRDKKIGSGLLRTYLSICSGSLRHLLWVKDTNENAIKRYNHYGYSADGTFDLIFVKE